MRLFGEIQGRDNAARLVEELQLTGGPNWTPDTFADRYDPLNKRVTIHQVLSLVVTVCFFFCDGGTRVSSEYCPGVRVWLVTPGAPVAVLAAASSIDGHAMTAKPTMSEKKWSDVFFLMLVKWTARVAVVTTLLRGFAYPQKSLLSKFVARSQA
jgi:hypothetical protein